MEGVELVWASNFRSPHLTLGAARSALRVAVSMVPHGISCRWCHVAAPSLSFARGGRSSPPLAGVLLAIAQVAMPTLPVLTGVAAAGASNSSAPVPQPRQVLAHMPS